MHQQQQDRQQPRSWPTRKQILWGGGITTLAFLLIVICGYLFGWMWTGFPKRTLWDWLELLIVPVVLVLGGYLFTRSENRRTQKTANQQRDLDRAIADQRTEEDRNIAQERAKTDRQIADQRRQDDTLQAYLDQIGQLLLDKDRSLRLSKEDDEVRTLARARTLTVLSRLDNERKGRVLQFLYEAGLITKGRRVLDLDGGDLSGADLREARLMSADLREADLSRAILIRADLREANLREANLGRADLREQDLSRADLRGAILSRADLSRANLSRANLREQDLSGAILTEADLRRANLSRARLMGANLSGAILRGANLSRANLSRAEGVTGEQLEQQVFSLEGATMPNGQKYEDWRKSKGRGGGENSDPS